MALLLYLVFTQTIYNVIIFFELELYKKEKKYVCLSYDDCIDFSIP